MGLKEGASLKILVSGAFKGTQGELPKSDALINYAAEENRIQ